MQLPSEIDTPVETTFSGSGPSASAGVFGSTAISELKERSVRGGGVAVLAQGMMFVLQTGSVMVLARLLSPADFGLQGMVVAFTGFLGLFRDAGLGAATVQREVLTHEQTSTLFWVNVALGAVLAITSAAMAPFLAAFFKEPRLLPVTIVSGTTFLFNSLAVQHYALLSRTMRFVTIAKINVLALATSVAVGVGMAELGCGYWSLVGMAVCTTVVTAAAAWVAMPWMPGKPARASGVRSMLHLGGTVTFNGLVVYIAYNTEKVLLGRFCGAEALGLYGRAYQLANMPVQQLNYSLGSVAFPALSRIQGDVNRVCRSFLKGYSVLVSVTIPITIICALFAEQVVRILLGPKWSGAAPVLRILAPTVLVFALINPFSWFLQATGRAVRSLNMAFLITPVVILGVVAGLRYGPTGVALGYSTAMVLLVVPLIAWFKHGTGITTRDYWDSVRRPLLAGAAASAAGWPFKVVCEGTLTAVPLLGLGLILALGVYAWILLVVMGQKHLYADLIRQVFRRGRPTVEGS